MFRKPDGAGKGDAPRPTDWDKFSDNFDKIFGRKDDKQSSKAPQTKDDDKDKLEG